MRRVDDEDDGTPFWLSPWPFLEPAGGHLAPGGLVARNETSEPEPVIPGRTD